MDFASILAPFGSFLAPFGSLLAPFGSIQGVTSTNTVYFTFFSAVSDIQGTACAAGCRLRRRSAAPLWGFKHGVSNQTSYSADPCHVSDSKSFCGPNLRRRPLPQKSCGRPSDRRDHNFFDVLQTFCPSKIHQKSDLYQTPPKSQKSDPWVPKARFWSHYR